MSNDTAIASLQEKIDDLNQQAWEVRVTDLPKSFELSQESVKLARSINYPKGLAEGLRSLGFSYVRYSKNDEAAPLLKESLSLFQSLNDLKGQAVIYEYLGIIERNWGNLGASLDLLLKANKLVLQIDSQEIEITCSYQLGVTYKHLGDHENALDYLYKTLSLAKKMNFTLMEAYATNIIGSIYFDNGNYNQALDCYQQGLIIRRQSNDKWGEAGSLDNIGFTYLKLNDLDKAIDHCKQSLAMCQATGDKKGEANALLHLGEIYEQAGDIKQAAGFSNKSLEIRKERGDKRGETEVLLFLADLYKNRSDVEDHQIFEWLSGALKIADEIKAQDLLSKTHYNLHEYYQQKGDFKESLAQLDAHFQIEKELHKNSINQKIANLEISHKAEIVSQRNKELTELNEKIEKANEELKIEAALEKIRSRTNAMHRSESLHEVINEVNDQLRQLGFPFDSTDFLTDYSDKGYNLWVANFPTPIYVPAMDHKVFHLLKEAIKRGDNFFTFTLTTEEKNIHFKNVFENTIAKNSPEELKQYLYNAKGMATSCVVLKNIILSVTNFASVPYTDRENEILKRFAFVFEQSYTRFLDLQKAEAQTRESQIQLALERVRARTMAMQHSEELKDAAALLFQQVQSLGMSTWSAGYCIWDEDKRAITAWMSSEGVLQLPFRALLTEDPSFIHFREAYERGETFFVEEIGGEALVKHYKYVHSQPVGGEIQDSIIEAGHPLPTFQIFHCAYFSQGFLLFITYEPVPEAWDIFKRFAKVFEQTYTRFLDLQKAEAQTREAQIEVAVERIRAKALAMHNSEEITGVARTLRNELGHLNIEGLFAATIYLEQDDGTVRLWDITISDNIIENGPKSNWDLKVRLEELHPRLFIKRIWAATEKYFVIKQNEQDFPILIEWVSQFKKEDAEEIERAIKENNIKHTWFAGVQLEHGRMSIELQVPPPNEAESILSKIGAAFDLAYKRFLDLQKAEAQTRESQIELALERVRARTMAMQKSEELKDVIQVVYEQFVQLNIHIEHTGFVMDYKARYDYDIWIADKLGVPSHVTIPYFDSVYYNRFNEAKKKGEDFFAINLDFEEKNRFYKKIIDYIPGLSEEIKEFLFTVPGLAASTVLLENVCLYIENFSGTPYTDEENATLMRFGKVFQQTYTRFLDLKNAETQAREAQIEAALEKVRSRTLAMQKSDELAETAAEVFRQLIGLGIEPNRLYIGIVKDETGDMEMWATDEDGTQVGKRFMFNKNENASVLKLYDGWKTQKRSVIVDMQGKELEDYFHYLNNVMRIPFKGGLTQKRRVQSVAYFSKGFIGMASPDGQGDETIQLLERFAAVFNLTFTRFNDLKIAEAHAVQAKEDLVKLQTEKKRAEDALSELQVTQKQLIQSEKMASLGELTAGIAHEIQNPLNFVNNFSDVNKELLGEMKEEIEKGNIDEVIAIANDIISNEEKINHHGKRADAIVKGMLQHSRSSSGIKEPTDINELADEYLRLAYHGLRAKDKTFNATMKTDFDEKIGKVNVIPQEIGRVFLNLITNAFYVVAEKKKQLANGYEPTVTVTTKKESDKVVVSVKDNGNGIPQKVLDKIFQPFFTTKPTGQGTGLGLSLSYDIVKAHSGEIKVKTKDGEGSEFVIQLPIDQ